MGWDLVIGPLFRILDKVIPDPQAREAAKVELIKQQNSQELELIKTELAAIVAEAQSPDPWTSRARPSFLYVMYFLILLAVPVALAGVFFPAQAETFKTLLTGYFTAIPDSLYALFGTGYLGYTAARQWGKVKGVNK